MNIKGLIFLLIIMTLSAEKMTAGAWTQAEGGYYLKLETSYMNTFKEFNHNGDELNILEEKFIFKDASFRDFTIRAYYEYGFFDILTVIAKVPFKIYTTEYFLDDVYSKGKVSRSTAGFGDLNLAFKYALLRNPTAVSIQGGIKVPLGYAKKPDNDGPRLGTSEIDLEGILLIGQSFYPLPLYLSAGIGYRQRGGEFHDEIIYNFETGYTFDELFFKVYLSGIKNTHTPPDLYGGEIQLPLQGGGGVIPDILFGDQDINQVSFSMSFALKEGMAIEATVFDILSGKNTVAGQTYSLGFVIYK